MYENEVYQAQANGGIEFETSAPNFIDVQLKNKNKVMTHFVRVKRA